MDGKAFLESIFGDALSPERRLCIWTHHPDESKRSTRFFANADDAVAHAMTRTAEEKANVYFGLGLIAGQPKGRGELKDVCAIGSLWVDIDIRNAAHKKQNLPKNFQAALALLDKGGLKPSIIIHSGHGLQAYWLLKEPWVFESDEERMVAARLTRRWSDTWRAIAKGVGVDVDAVGDLTRVFRLPGTMNRKGDPVEVRIIESDESIRYNPDDFDALLIDEEAESEKLRGGQLMPVAVGAVMLNPDADPPGMKLRALIENDVKFKRSLSRTRKDLQDQSASSYDLSLATIAADAGWTDQEIADLVIASRRENGDDMTKALRRDYLMRTIARAKTGIGQARLAEEVGRMSQPVPAGEPATAVPSTNKSELLGKLSLMLGVPISRWIQHGRENARYSLVMTDGRAVRIGAAGDVLNHSSFAKRMYEAGRVINPMKGKTWMEFTRGLIVAAEVVENEEASSSWQAEQWVKSYLSDHAADSRDWQDAAAGNEPFIKDGKLHISASELRKHMRVLQHEHGVDRIEVLECLRSAGFTRISTSFRHEARVLNRSFWVTADFASMIDAKDELPAKEEIPI